MAVFSTEKTQLGAHDIVILRDAERQREVRIARHGATVIAIEQTHRGVLHALADGYRDSAELDSRPSSRFAIMVPFANRIADARYTFDGQPHDLQPGVAAAQRAARHGFVRGIDFDIAAVSADQDGAHAAFTTQAIRPGAFEGFPYAIDLTVSYTLDARGLTLVASMRNVGSEAAPCFFGWHPYLRVADGIVDTWELMIPAATLIRMDADYIPLAGAAAYQPLDEAPPELDFRTAHAIGATEVNHGYANLRYDADGRARTRLSNPATGVSVAVWQERGILLAFTADTVTRDVRRAVALEPMESMSDAFNRPDCAEAIRLEPGAERQFRCGIEVALT